MTVQDFRPALLRTSQAVFDPLLALAVLDSQPDGQSQSRPALCGDMLPKKSGHLVFNFEVEVTHTYIADGLRVHNTSILGMLSADEMRALALGGLDNLKDLQNSIEGPDYITLDMPDGSGKTAYKMVTVDGKLVLQIYHTYLDEETGQLMQSQMLRNADGTIIADSVKLISLTGANFGEQVGTMLTPFLTSALLGDDTNPFQRIAANTVLGTFLENLFEATGGYIHDQIASAGRQNDILENVIQLTFQDIVTDLGANAVDYTRQELTNWIMLEVFGQFANDSYAGEVFNTLASQGVSALVGAGMYEIASDILGLNDDVLAKLGLSAFDSDYLFGGLTEQSPGVFSAGVFSLPGIATLSLKIGFQRLLPEIETIEGQIASGLTSLALNTFTTFLDKFTVAFASGIQMGSGLAGIIGAFNPVIMIISTLVGKLFDALFEQHPEAYTNVLFNETTGLFELGTTWSDDGGNKEIGKQMAESYVDFMNGLLEQAQSNENNALEVATTLRLVFGHYEDAIRNGAARNFDSIQEALQSRIIDTIQELNFVDGDLKTIESMDQIITDANLVNDIHSFGAYSYWKTFFGIKISKKTVYTDINPEAAKGMDNAELVEIVEKWDVADTGNILSSIVAKANAIYSDLKLTSVTDVAGIQKIVERMVGSSWASNLLIGATSTWTTSGGYTYTSLIPNKAMAVDVLGDVLYLRALAVTLMNDHYSFTTQNEMIEALKASHLTIKTDAQLYATLVYNMQIAAEYQEYLENKSAYDAAIAAAGPDSAYAEGWALTFLEAERLGLIDGYTATGGTADNNYLTSVGADSIRGGAGNDTVRSYAGNDTLLGEAGNDALYGGIDNDALYGGTGNDLLIGGSGDDTLAGGTGNDIFEITGAMGNRLVRENADEGSDTLRLSGDIDYRTMVISSPSAGVLKIVWDGGSVTYYGIQTVEYTAEGVDYKVRVGNGTIGDDLVMTGGGADSLLADAGNDIIVSGGGADSVNAGAGNDTLLGGTGADTLDGGDGTDTADYARSTVGVQVDLRGVAAAGWLGNLLGEAQGDVLSNIENLRGSAFDDVFVGSAGSNTLDGDQGHDSIMGGAGADRLLGGEGNDTLLGEDGSDRLIGGDGADSLIGGVSIDAASYETALDGVLADLQVASSNSGEASGDRYSQIENLYGSTHNDNLRGDAGDNLVNGLEGNDTLYGRDGDDTLNGNLGNDALNGGLGADIINGGDGTDQVSYGSSTAAVTVDLRGPDYVGWWSIKGGDAAGDTLISIENVYGSALNDQIVGGDNNSVLSGAAGDDGLHGWVGNDALYGGDGDDRLYGGDGNDILFGGTGADAFYGGAGNDRVQYSDVASGLRVDLANAATNTGVAAGDTFVSIVNLYGTNYNDTLLGDAGANIVWGANGNDIVLGQGGGDTLYGGNGNDTLRGGAGPDTLNGDAGLDTADYAGAGTAITASLAAGNPGAAGDALGDVFSGIENLAGSSFADRLTGNEGSNALSGQDGNDILESGSGGADTLNGGAGDDVLYARQRVGGINAWDGVADELYGGAGNDSLYGYDFGARLVGGAGRDYHYAVAFGSLGHSYLQASTRDTFASYRSATSGIVADLSGLVAGTGDAALDLYYNILNLEGSAFADRLLGNAYGNALSGGAGNDSLSGAAANDILIGGAGGDTLDGGIGDDTADYSEETSWVQIDLRGPTVVGWWQNKGSGAGDVLIDVENLIGTDANDIFVGDDAANRLTGGNGNDSLHGWTGDDYILGGTGADYLVGNAGSDTLEGGTGSDIYSVDSSGDRVIELEGQGEDSVRASVSYTLTAFVEKLELLGTAALNGTGNSQNNSLQGNEAANILNGLEGNDTLLGMGGADIFRDAAGADRYDGGAGYDQVDYAAATAALNIDMLKPDDSRGIARGDVFVSIEAVLASAYDDTVRGSSGGDDILGRNGNDIIFGRDGNDDLRGEAGNDIIFGGLGADTLDGGTGIDRVDYNYSSTGVQVDLRGALGWGNKGGEAEGDVLTGFQNLYGSQFGDTLVGDTAANVLVGDAGNDALHGWDGNDTLYGGAGNDSLSGNSGTDNMQGGLGNDVYAVDSAADVITEAAGEGIDRVNAGFAYTLGANVENLLLTGTANIAGNGNALDNLVTGNAGDNQLNGLAGDDTLQGGDGNDSFWDWEGANRFEGGNGNDSISLWGVANQQAYGGAGDDIIYASSTNLVIDGGTGLDSLTFYDIMNLVMGSIVVDLENDALNTGMAAGTTITGVEEITSGFGNDTLRGDAADNILNSDYGNDILSGAAGDDTLNGGEGNDILLGGLGADSLVGGNGIDRAQYLGGTGAVTVDLANAAANTGAAAGDIFSSIENLHGSEANDVLRGNSGANTIWGGTGDDVIQGRTGNDVLVGHAGADRFVFTSGDGADVITDFANNTDVLDLRGYGITTFAQLSTKATQVGTDLVLNFGTGGTITLNNLTLAVMADDLLFTA